MKRRSTLYNYYAGRYRFLNFEPIKPIRLSVQEEKEELQYITENKWFILNVDQKINDIFLYDEECLEEIEAFFIDFTATPFCVNLVICPFKSALASFNISLSAKLICFSNILYQSNEAFLLFEEELRQLLICDIDTDEEITLFCKFAEIYGQATLKEEYSEITAEIFHQIEKLVARYELSAYEYKQLANFCIYITRGMQSEYVGANFAKLMLELSEQANINVTELEDSLDNCEHLISYLAEQGFESPYINWYALKQEGVDISSKGRLETMLNSDIVDDQIMALEYLQSNEIAVDAELQKSAIDCLKDLNGKKLCKDFDGSFCRLEGLELK